MSSQDANDRPVSADERRVIKSAIEAEKQHLAELQNSIAEHKAAIKSLKHTSKEMKTRIASHRTLISSYKFIPDELLGHIFTMVDYQPYFKFSRYMREDFKDHVKWGASIVTPAQWRCRGPLNVCHVSRRWRRVAMSTPHVWSDLVVDLKKKHPVDMMEHWFKLAKAVPVCVTLWCEGNPYLLPVLDTDIDIIGLCTACIGKHLSQAGSLRLVVENEIQEGEDAYEDFSRFCKAMSCVDGTSASGLRSLAISSMYTDQSWTDYSSLLPPFPFEILGNIATLDIKGFFVSDAFLACVPASLTVLKLNAPNQSGRPATYANVLTALSSLPNLHKLQLCGQYTAVYNPNNGDQPLSSRQQIVQMPHLTKLTLTRYSCATYVRFLCAPALQHLKIKERRSLSDRLCKPPQAHAWTVIGPLVSSFLARSRPPLAKFSAIDIEVDLKEEELVGWLGQMDTVECLVVSLSPVLVDAVTSALVLKRDDGESFCYCPNLKVFKCRWWGQRKDKKARSLVGRDDTVVCGRMKYDSKWTQQYDAGGQFGKCWK